MAEQGSYGDDAIKTLEWQEHIRLRPGMYIGKLGDGASHDDGIYILLKEVIDNSIDEFTMGHGKRIEVTIDTDSRVASVRDYGRGIPLGKVVDCASKINTGAKYDSNTFQKSVGLNGVGIKAANALSSDFVIKAVREGQYKEASFIGGIIKDDPPIRKCDEPNGTAIRFIPDPDIFKNYAWQCEYVDAMLANYSYLNIGLELILKDHRGTQTFKSENGLLDLMNATLARGGQADDIVYPPIHLRGPDIEMVLTHGSGSNDEIHSFTNGQNTHQGGTHVAAFREGLIKVVREFFQKDYDTSDIRSGVVAAISVRVQEPVFESQTKTKLGSTVMFENGPTLRAFVYDFLKKELDNFLHKNPDTQKALLEKILSNERERKELAGIKDVARKRAKRAGLRNPNLMDCKTHYNSTAGDRASSSIFITEGDSASGSIAHARTVNHQAVFSLRGKPLNTFGMTKKVVYENEEFYMLQDALNIEDGMDGLRYNNIILATDADVDGMHIRLLMVSFFLQFFPEVVKDGHLYILQTPLFRVRNKKETAYCFSIEEKDKALARMGAGLEITRFKGLGEVNVEEFEEFIGPAMRLDPVVVGKDTHIQAMLDNFMGANTPARRDFIIENLRSDIVLEKFD